MAAFTKANGFGHYAYHVRLVPGEIERDLIVYTSYPEAWVQRYVEQDYFQIDPVIKLAQFNIMPINWDDFDQGDSKVSRLVQERQAFGVGPRGLTVPIRGAVGDFALFSVTCGEDHDAWRAKLPGRVGEVVVAAYEFHAAVMSICVEEDHETRPLSTRERQVLTLAGQGMPHKSVAFALAISESAVKLYLDSARNKLGAHNTAQAIGYAVSRHLIASPP
ncbi:histidine kinase [Alsobacter metallidurans]|uniref:Histidine kinase n=1 Tax=Alsobacter metallidurans TaxID=340221 RepID=A0A917I424_9HYPH|nr:LuxR family transcriptional regulator [Alsobacter metallidurans]GGH08701.1 histidine kinase [Alsobacter metallidurans]